MTKYLVTASYTADGAKGLLKDGGSKRLKAASDAIQKVGGRIEAFYYTFGDHDAVIIAEFPDAVSATALSVTIAASGAVRLSTVPLLTVQDMDEACKKHPSYVPPGA